MLPGVLLVLVAGVLFWGTRILLANHKQARIGVAATRKRDLVWSRAAPAGGPQTLRRRVPDRRQERRPKGTRLQTNRSAASIFAPQASVS